MDTPSAQLPEPLIPADVDADLRGFRNMPLDVPALLQSDFFATSSGQVFKAAFSLWAAAWHQIPAGSLPDDDRILARCAGLAGNLRVWKKIKSEALHGFTLCTDRRWYHAFLCKVVLSTARLKRNRAKGGEVTAKKIGSQCAPQAFENAENTNRSSAAVTTAQVPLREELSGDDRKREARQLRDVLVEEFSLDPQRCLSIAAIGRWLGAGYAPEEVLAVAKRLEPKLTGGNPLAYLDKAMDDQVARLRRENGSEVLSEEAQRSMCLTYFATGTYDPNTGRAGPPYKPKPRTKWHWPFDGPPPFAKGSRIDDNISAAVCAELGMPTDSTSVSAEQAA